MNLKYYSDVSEREKTHIPGLCCRSNFVGDFILIYVVTFDRFEQQYDYIF